MHNIVKREAYIEKIRPFFGKPLIKVITGIRRCGKSTMLLQIIDELIKDGADPERIIKLNLDDIANSDLTAKGLYQKVMGSVSGDGTHHVFLDEIQNVHGWEHAVNSLLQEGNLDIYISGSNSRLLSSELATFIAGRYVSIEMNTLSFSEFIEFKRTFSSYKGDGKDLLKEYMRRGGFPLASIGDFDLMASDKIVKDTFESIFLRDTVVRNNLRNTKQLESLLSFMFDNIGNPFSARNISNQFQRNGIKISPGRILEYIGMLESAYLLRSVKRYDLRGKRIVGSEDKYYVSDVSLIYALIGFKATMVPGIEENMVFLELLRRGYAVTVGRLEGKEVDFVAERNGSKIYVQVTHALYSQETADREFSSLESIRDSYPKYVVVAEDTWRSERNGIVQMGLADFLLDRDI